MYGNGVTLMMAAASPNRSRSKQKEKEKAHNLEEEKGAAIASCSARQAICIYMSTMLR